MSMTKQGTTISFPAGADLSEKQYFFVAMSGSSVVLADASDAPLGVLQNKPEEGEHAHVMLDGITPLRIIGPSLATGAQVASNAAGGGVALTNEAWLMGRVLIASVSGSTALATVKLDGASYHSGSI